MSGERRRVNFSDSPPSGSSSRVTSDSGVGSLSDHGSHESKPDRASAAYDVQGQWNDLPALQEAYRRLYDSKQHWKDKAKRLDEENIQVRQQKKDIEAQWRTVVERVEQLENDKAKILKDKKAELVQLQEDNSDMRQKLAEAHAKVESLRRNSPPVMSGANPASSSRPRRSSSLHRSSSKRDPDKDQKHRLERRFESKDDGGRSDNTTSSKGTSRNTRRGSYIEPFGPGPEMAPPPPPAPPPQQQQQPGVRAQYATYSQSTQAPPTFSRVEEPKYSSVPRTMARPQVVLETDYVPPVRPSVYVEDTFVEDGNYHAYALPGEHSGRGGLRPRGSSG